MWCEGWKTRAFCWFGGGHWQERRVCVFEGGWYPNLQYDSSHMILTPPIEVYPPPTNIRKNFQIKSPHYNGGSRNHGGPEELNQKCSLKYFLIVCPIMTTKKEMFN